MNRLQRYGLIFFVLYFVFIGGSPYFQIPVVRYFHHIIMTVLLGGWLGWRLWHGRGMPASPMNIPLFLFVLLAAISIPFSLDPRVSLEYLWFVVITSLSYWFIVNMFQTGKAKLAYEVLFLGAFLVVFLSALQVASALWGWGLHGGTPGWLNFIGEKINFPVDRDLRIFLPFGASTWVSGVSAPLCVLAMAWAFAQKSRISRWVFWILTALLAGVTFLTFSRGGWLSLGASVILFTALRFFRGNLQFNRKTIYAFAGIGFVVILVGVAVFSSGVFSRRQSGDAIRFDIWSSATNLIQDDPLTGVGIGQFGHGYRLYRSNAIADDRHTHAHNLYLNGIAEMGVLIIPVMLLALRNLLRVWWHLRNSSAHESSERIILDGFFVALAGFLFHHLFDTMQLTFAILLVGLMVTVVTVKPSRTPTLPVSLLDRVAAGLALVIVLGYGFWFVAIVDPAQRAFQESLSRDENALENAQIAKDLDPGLHLYDLQIAYLLGWQAYEEPTTENLQIALASYEAALQLEPTWDTGWMNRAVLHELDGDLPAALDAFDRARRINLRTSASIHWARIAEALGTIPDRQVVDTYLEGLSQMLVSRLPLSPFWTETALRQQALSEFLDGLSHQLQYRILRVHQPEQAQALIPENPESAQDWWILGESLLASQDAAGAFEAFSEAIDRSPIGDYFVSRARSAVTLDPTRAVRDLEIARFVGTYLEFPSAVQLALATTPEEIEQYRIGSVPFPRINQGFEAVLYLSRTASFNLFPEANFTSYGTAIMQPWYDLALEYEASGDSERAIRVYETIGLLAYDEPVAQQALMRLQAVNSGE